MIRTLLATLYCIAAVVLGLSTPAFQAAAAVRAVPSGAAISVTPLQPATRPMPTDECWSSPFRLPKDTGYPNRGWCVVSKNKSCELTFVGNDFQLDCYDHGWITMWAIDRRGHSGHIYFHNDGTIQVLNWNYSKQLWSNDAGRARYRGKAKYLWVHNLANNGTEERLANGHLIWSH